MKNLSNLTKDKVLFSEHCTCIEFKLEKEQIKKLVESFQELQKEREDSSKEEGTLLTRLSLSTHSEEKDRHRIVVDIHVKREISVDEVNELISHEQEFYDILGRYDIKEADGTSCSTFLFDTNHYTPAGGLVIPARIDMKEVEEKFGKVKIGGFILTFEDSPIGVDKVTIEIRNNLLNISISINYRLSSMEEHLRKSFDLAKQVAYLFVVKK